MSDTGDGWLGIDLRHLLALEAIAREGTFRGAAEALGYVQSAVSQQLAQLERQVGARLVERSPGSVPIALTDAGRVLVEHVEELLRRYGAAASDVAAASRPDMPALRVGVCPSVAASLLPRVVSAFATRRRDVRIVPVETPDGDAARDALASRELDLAFCDLPAGEGLQTEELLRDPFVLVVAADSPLARRGVPPTPAELAALPLIGVRSRAHELVERWLRSHDVEPRTVLRGHSGVTVQALVAAGAGIAIAPALAVDAGDPAIAVRELDGGPSPRVVALAWDAQRQPCEAAARFRDIARAVCSAYEAP